MPESTVDLSKIARLTPRRLLLIGLGFFIVLALWFSCRTYITSVYQTQDNPSVHPLYPVFHDMAIALDEGQPLGTLNVSRLQRNALGGGRVPYDARALPDDKFCMYKALDPGYAKVLQVSRHLFYFLPDTFHRAIAMQAFVDLALLILIYITFLSWGILPAMGAATLFALNPDFAFLSVTPFYSYWDGIVAAVVLLGSLWAWRYARQTKTRYLAFILIAIIGGTMGLGVWLRAAWFVYGLVIFALLLCFKRLRRPALLGIFIFALIAGSFIAHNSMLQGKPTLSTRMMWHTAFQALGRYPNKYGLEDDDLFLFERSKNKYGVDYNLCDYSGEDDAMHTEYNKLYARDPGYIVQSIISRAFTNITFNFDQNWRPFWNLGVLAMAWLGGLWAIICGGELLMLAALCGELFFLVCLSTAPLYYIIVNYAYVTQLCLTLLCASFAHMVATALRTPQLLTRTFWQTWRGTIFSNTVNRFTAVNIIVMASLLATIVVLTPPVQHYLTITRAPDRDWVAPATLLDSDIDFLLQKWQALPPKQQNTFLNYVHKFVPVTSNTTADIAKFAHQNLRIIANYSEALQAQQALFVNRRHATDVYEALNRAARYILGWRFDSLTGFDIADPASWDGSQLSFSLTPNTQILHDEFNMLLQDKFTTWNWQVTETAPWHYNATHTGGGCSPTRRLLAGYLNRKCE